MKNVRRMSWLVLISCVAGGAGFLIAYKVKSRSQEFSRVPLIAQIAEKHFAKPSSALPVAVTYSTYARRSDGSEVHIIGIHSPDGQLAQLRGFKDVASGRQVQLEPFTASVSTQHLSANQMRSLIDSDESCPGTVGAAAAEHSRILGYDVVRVHGEIPGQDRETFDRWVAPALNCLALWESSALSSGAHNERQVTVLVEGEPPDSMFAVPPDYVERSPSQVAAEWAARFPGHIFMSAKAAKLHDRVYYAHQNK